MRSPDRREKLFIAAGAALLVGIIVLIGLIWFTPVVSECFSHCGPEYGLQGGPTPRPPGPEYKDR
jgi:hypothetical protein